MSDEPVEAMEVDVSSTAEPVANDAKDTFHVQGAAQPRHLRKTTVNALGHRRLIRTKDIQHPTENELGSGDSFVFDSGEEIFAFLGERSSQFEKCKALSVARQIRD